MQLLQNESLCIFADKYQCQCAWPVLVLNTQIISVKKIITKFYETWNSDLNTIFFFFSENMASLLHYLFLGTVASLTILAVIVTAYVRYIYGYWKRKKVPYLEPIFPFGNADSLLPQGISIGIISRKFYDEFKSKGHMAGGKTDLNDSYKYTGVEFFHQILR